MQLAQRQGFADLNPAFTTSIAYELPPDSPVDGIAQFRGSKRSKIAGPGDASRAGLEIVPQLLPHGVVSYREWPEGE
jgi:hypothetical protein